MKTVRISQIILISSCLIGCSGLKPKPIYKAKGKEKSTNQDKAEVEPQHPVVDNPELLRNNLDREKMMSEIENLLGVPYRFGGTTTKGMDCSGFVQFVYKNAIGYTLPRMVIDMVQIGGSVGMDQLQFGDLVFFNKIEDKGTSHVGIYLDSNQFVHASVSKGVIFSGLDEPYYRSRYVTARRITFE